MNRLCLLQTKTVTSDLIAKGKKEMNSLYHVLAKVIINKVIQCS